MQIGTSIPPGQERATINLGVMRSRVKVTGGRSLIWRLDGDIILDLLSRVGRGIQRATEMLPLKSWVVMLHIVLTVPIPPYGGYASMRLADALILFGLLFTLIIVNCNYQF